MRYGKLENGVLASTTKVSKGTQTTGTNGEATFSNLDLGRYYVEEILEYDFLLRVTVKHTWRNYTDNIKVDNFSFDSLEELLGFFRMKDIELKGVIEW